MLSKRTSAAVLILVAIIAGALVLSTSSVSDSSRPISLLIGAALGFVFERGRFCFFCLFRDATESRHTRPLLSVITAIAVGAIGYAVMFGLYLPNSKGEGLPPGAHIAPVSLPLIVGAAAFGLGMVLSGACISGHLYRIGQGYLRAIPALIGSLIGFGLGFFTWNTLFLEQVSESPVLWLPRWLGYSGSLALVLFVLAVLAIFLLRVNRQPADEPIQQPLQSQKVGEQIIDVLFTRRWTPVATGTLVGLIGVVAYIRTTPLGVTSQLSSISRSVLDSRQLLPEVLHGIDMMRGCVATVSSTISNNGWLVIGFVAASLAAAVGGGRFKLQVPTLGNSASALLGGVFLGWGSLTALGCTVGVLLSGTQAFAVSGFVFLIVVFATVTLGVRLRLHQLFGA
ncbi:MAG: hypothetical protein RLZZ260_355 [Actinomycetota bacterium]|jgi:uncharacterized membrane protein YedE/YeeE